MVRTDSNAVCENCKKGILCTTAIPLFRALPQPAQEILTEQAIHSTREKGSFLFRMGENVESIYVIRQGRIKLCKYDADGNEYILDIRHDGDTLWENIFPEHSVYPYAAVCLSTVELCEIRKNAFTDLLTNNPGMALELVSMLSLRLQESSEKVLLLSIHDPKIRLAGFLLDRDIRCIGPEINLRLEDIAASIGLRPETVSRCLSKFEKDNLIRRLGQGRIAVTDRIGLRKIYESS